MENSREHYAVTTFRLEDAILTEVRQEILRRGMPDISVHPLVGAFLTFLARIHQSREILEIGTLGGYSAICLTRALPPEGRLVSLDINPDYVAVAQENLHRAGLAERVTHMVGPATLSLKQLADQGQTFDFILIDADKEHYPVYLEQCLKILRAGGVLAADNTLWHDEVLNPESHGEIVEALRHFNRRVAEHPALEGILWPVADGLTVARYRGPG